MCRGTAELPTHRCTGRAAPRHPTWSYGRLGVARGRQACRARGYGDASRHRAGLVARREGVGFRERAHRPVRCEPAILREAVRILEHHGAVRTKRGPQGGVIVTAPAGDAIVRSAGIVLAYEGLTAAQLFEARAALEGSAVRRAAARCTPEIAAGLLDALALETDATDPVAQFMPLHRLLPPRPAITSSSCSSTFSARSSQSTPGRGTHPPRAQSIAEDTHRAHGRIVEAIVAGDPGFAERNMLRHLRASVGVLQNI